MIIHREKKTNCDTMQVLPADTIISVFNKFKKLRLW
jgi:hypothetical protein